jgi:hypothetical protein
LRQQPNPEGINCCFYFSNLMLHSPTISIYHLDLILTPRHPDRIFCILHFTVYRYINLYIKLLVMCFSAIFYIKYISINLIVKKHIDKHRAIGRPSCRIFASKKLLRISDTPAGAKKITDLLRNFVVICGHNYTSNMIKCFHYFIFFC